MFHYTFIVLNVISYPEPAKELMRMTGKQPLNGSAEDKKDYIRKLFDTVAPRYNLINHLLSFGADIYWRRQIIRLINFDLNRKVLDLGSGTGDLALLAVKRGAHQVIAVDISSVMLEQARKKFEKKDWLGFYRPVCGDGEFLPLGDQSVDAVMSAFGIRNMTDLEKTIDEIARVLNGSGLLVVLEFSKPGFIIFRHLFRIYFKYILPPMGTWLSGHRSAYYYLPRSVDEFPEPSAFKALLGKKGFTDIRSFSMMLGVVTAYCGMKL
jgi:demethylmenaquinone methyltransferase / 2-methoxy-6-polyprenyl-1,4-benzoquinol methylase